VAFPRAKSTLFDPGLEVALIMRFPSGWRAPPRVHADLVSHVDVLPTILEMLDLPVPDRVQGRSFAGWLRGEGSHTPRDEVFGEKNWHDVDQYDPVRCIRTRTHKYIRSYEERPTLLLPGDIETSPTRRGMGDAHLAPRASEELYHLSVDPHERRNLAADPEHEDVRDALAGRLEAWRYETADPLLAGPLPAPVGQVSDAWGRA
jgi:arylsulfatase A-like enzyme